VEWLIGKGHSRNSAVIVTSALRAGEEDEFLNAAGMRYEDGYWVVPA
jgi:hypothetical protein